MRNLKINKKNSKALASASIGLFTLLTPTQSLFAKSPVVKPEVSATTNTTVEIKEDFIPQNNLQVKKIISGKQDALKRTTSTFDYYVDSVYDIYTTPDFVTMVKLEPSENIVALKGGNINLFDIEQDFGGPDNSVYLFITPKDIEVTSNLIVMTDKRVYNINLFSTLDIYNPHVKFNYPVSGNTMSYKLNTPSGTSKTQATINIENLDMNYTFSPKKTGFTPTRVYNDGLKTIIELPQNMQEAPTLMVKGTNGKEYEVVNTQYDRNRIVVHRVVKDAVLILGKQKVRIKHQ